jgi:hypothetical protein
MIESEKIFTEIKSSLARSGLFHQEGNGGGPQNVWRISPEPYYLSPDEVDFFSRLGHHLHKFYVILNQLYLDSIKGRQPGWVAEYLDMGKPEDLLNYCRMKRFRGVLPGIIRPDVIVTEDGFTVTELDSVPGGFGLTAGLMTLYKKEGRDLIGEGIPELFYRMAESVAGAKGCKVGIIVSDEAEDYRSEMQYLSSILKDIGLPVFAVHPEEVVFQEEGLFVRDREQLVRLDVVYRFFELFDLKNIPKSELLMYSNKKGFVKTTPPYKPWLEEKLGFALFHHPSLAPVWENALGGETFAALTHLIPKTWVLDNRELPPYGVIPDLKVKGIPVREWEALYPLTQKERELVVKPSGFSPDSWGSRGVIMGHDVPSEEWKKHLQKSLERFPETPSILQEFRKGKKVNASYFNPQARSLVDMPSRVRLTPYYFMVDDAPRLGGILATLCPQDKKKIHGMAEAILVPCALRES